MDDDDIQRRLDDLKAYCDARLAEEGARILAHIDEQPPMFTSDDDVILLGLEGEVVKVWAVPHPRPGILKMATPPRNLWRKGDLDAAQPIDINILEFERVGEFTYQRRK